MTSSHMDNVYFLGSLLTYFSTGDLIWRIILFICDVVQNKKSRKLHFRIYFSGSFRYSVGILGCVIIYYLSQGKTNDLLHLALKCILAAFIYCLYQVWNEGCLLTSVRFIRRSHLDCGTGMAKNFYNGYLKIVLPPKEDGTKGIVERINDCESRENIEIPLKKLLLLLPRDLYITPLLSDVTDVTDKILKITNIEKIARDRCGTTKRVYKNTLYKLYPKEYYVVAEAATPLLTWYEDFKHPDEMENLLAEEVYVTFCNTLENMITSSPELRDLIVLIPVPCKTSGEEVAKLLSDEVDKHLYSQIKSKIQ